MQEKTMSRQNMAADNTLTRVRTMWLAEVVFYKLTIYKFFDIDMLMDLVFGDLAEISEAVTGETIHVTIRKAGTP